MQGTSRRAEGEHKGGPKRKEPGRPKPGQLDERRTLEPRQGVGRPALAATGRRSASSSHHPTSPVCCTSGTRSSTRSWTRWSGGAGAGVRGAVAARPGSGRHRHYSWPADPDAARPYRNISRWGRPVRAEASESEGAGPYCAELPRFGGLWRVDLILLEGLDGGAYGDGARWENVGSGAAAVNQAQHALVGESLQVGARLAEPPPHAFDVADPEALSDKSVEVDAAVTMLRVASAYPSRH